MRVYKLCALLLLLTLSVGCRSTKTLTTTADVDKNMTAKQIIRENAKQDVRFKTLQAKVRIDYTDGDKSNGTTVTLRMEKDKVIWMSAPLAIARVMITQDSVKFYDKLNNQYFDGDFSLLTRLLGTDIDFEKIQNIFLGEPIFNLKDDTYVTVPNEESYVLQPKDQRALFELFFLVNPGFFKLDSQQLFQPKEKRMLQIDYKKYQGVSKQIFPENIRIIAVEKNDEIIIDLDFKAISLNGEVRFPFNIPSGYKEIELE
ncbi:DUF4292 domain-containing protein [Gelidibacter salicanalis]|uniref:DUF4292 domain-containing protein n=1 Tax=Gelidibacter salicanalis TaxID=291193 RepID=A0A934KS64_9FLAO|nr:DUF4292 domain-containing protein [Gelidibacter salicanalis]MBJ7879708.1 DUF4292 domain-containing protein [Gelidibacter salicanalis]